MSKPLIIPQSSLVTHFGMIGESIDSHVDSSAHVKMFPEWDILPLIAGLVGDGCERVVRNRGANVQAAPMMNLGAGLWAWISYREEWDSEPPSRAIKRFSFRASSLTVYFGYRNSLHKPQMFRAEWAGFAKWSGAAYSYQANDAAHPHWQFDALESLTKNDVKDRADELLSILKGEEDAEVAKEFSPSVTLEDVSELVSNKEIGRLHFASAAPWWRNEPDDAHAYAPQSPTEIQLWLSKTLNYLSSELSRLINS